MSKKLRNWLERDRQQIRAEETREVTAGPRTKRKNLREFCRGNPKTPHTPELVLASWAQSWRKGCRWQGADYDRGTPRVPTRYRWSCLHQLRCSRCGKITDPFLDDRTACPDYPGTGP